MDGTTRPTTRAITRPTTDAVGRFQSPFRLLP